MKILLISELFYPSHIIGAIRPTKLAKYLTKSGITVDVVSRFPITANLPDDLFRSYYALEERDSSADAPGNASKEHSRFYKTAYTVYRFISNIRSAKYLEKRFNILLNTTLQHENYDVVISTFGPLSSLLCGIHYKKTHPTTKWICDFRDPVVVKGWPPLLRLYCRYIQEKACRKANIITTVSYGYLDRICGKKFRYKARVIPNGFDLEDAVDQVSQERSDERMTIAYVGALYDGKRDLRPLFQVLNELSETDEVPISRVCVAYAGGEFATLSKQADEYGMKDCLRNWGSLCRRDCLLFQASADILVLSTWNEAKEVGVFPGKFLEYMLINKPIIALVCGNLAGSEVKQVMSKGNFGITYEEANAREDYEVLKSYILHQYQTFTMTGVTEHLPNSDVKNAYRWDELIKRFQNLF